MERKGDTQLPVIGLGASQLFPAVSEVLGSSFLLSPILTLGINFTFCFLLQKKYFSVCEARFTKDIKDGNLLCSIIRRGAQREERPQKLYFQLSESCVVYYSSQLATCAYLTLLFRTNKNSVCDLH